MPRPIKGQINLLIAGDGSILIQAQHAGLGETDTLTTQTAESAAGNVKTLLDWIINAPQVQTF